MPGSPERTGKGIHQLPERNPRRKEASQFSLIEEICHGVEVVQMEIGERRYHVTWEKDNLPVHSFFRTIQRVLNQHERVMERYLGTEIPLVAGQLLEIGGEVQRMGEISGRLSTLGRRYLMPLSSSQGDGLKKEIADTAQEIGQVTNEFKRRAQAGLQAALLSPERRKQVDGVLEANLAILARNQECLLIVQGTLARFRRVSRKRDEWEGTIERSFKELAQAFNDLEKGDLTSRVREQIAWHISGARYGVFVRLSGITGSEYWERTQSREVQNLAHFGDFLREGNEQRAKRILEAAILKLERVVKEKQERAKKER